MTQVRLYHMIPFPNIIAGILIGVANDTWHIRLIVPFIWGIVYCVNTSIFRREKRDEFVARSKKLDRKTKLGMSHAQAFYFVEYWTASFTSLLFSVISGFIKGLF